MYSYEVPSYKKCLIYIIEDNKMYATMLREYLTVSLIKNAVTESVEIEIFQLAELCRDRLEREQARPDFVVVDYFLNSKYENASDGETFVRQLKKDYPEIKIIMLSSQRNIEVALSLVNAGICEYVVKGEEAFKQVESLIAAHVKKQIPEKGIQQ